MSGSQMLFTGFHCFVLHSSTVEQEGKFLQCLQCPPKNILYQPRLEEKEEKKLQDAIRKIKFASAKSS